MAPQAAKVRKRARTGRTAPTPTASVAARTRIPAPVNADVPWLTVRKAAHNNLKNVDVRFPLGRFICVTGVSGSGKSSLVNDILYKALARPLNRATTVEPGRHAGLDGLQHLDKVIAIDQSPIGRTPRSNPATYIKVFDEIRALFAKLPDAKLRGYKPGRFSFNVPTRRGGGRCEACEGNGSNRIEMDFLADVWVRCPVCEGRRFGRETLQIHYKGRSIADVLGMEVQEALVHFENVPRLRGMLQTLQDVGLDYIQLGQPSTTLSGGEAQRIKLARELVKRPTGRTLYVLDEPTTGLHFDDIRKLLAVLHGFVDAGNTVVVIEHNLDVLKTADWIIDLGPEGGEAGGYIVVDGTPEEITECEGSYTGAALREVLGGQRGIKGLRDLGIKGKIAPSGSRAGNASRTRPSIPQSLDPSIPSTNAITVVGARQHNLKDLTVSFPRNQMTVCTGVSGSGKTSFAIDTVFTEGYRRYVESLSAYARQFLGQMAKPRVDHVQGLSPAICIEQRAAGKSPRSTVGTVTEIYDYMRILWARIGTRYCPGCQVPIGTQTPDEVVARVMRLEQGAPIVILAPVSLGDGETYAALFNRLKSSGYTRVRIDGEIRLTAQATTLDARRKHRVEVVVDRTIVRTKSRSRIAESIEHALALGNGVITLVVEEVETVHEEGDEATERRSDEGGGQGNGGGVGVPPAGGSVGVPPASSAGPPSPTTREARATALADRLPEERSQFRVDKTPAREFMFSQKLACTQCGTSYEELGPNHFSFNSQLGWCETCEGLGVQRGAPAAAIIKNPDRSLFDGAVAGWHRIAPKSPLGRLLAALCAHLGLAPDTPLREWTGEQKRTLMFGTTGTWIDGSSAFGTPTPGSASSEPSSRWPMRFKWRGFFPAIDHATRNSWSFRHKLRHVVTDIPCVTCRGGRLRPCAAAVRLIGIEPGSAGAASGPEPGSAGPFGFAQGRPASPPEPSSAGPPSPASSLPGKTIADVCETPLDVCADYFCNLRLDERQRQIAGELLKEISDRLQFLIDVGLHYLTLHRAAPTLSGGEAQRIRLASQIGSGLSGVLYVLDEPTIGLHPRDTLRLIRALAKLRNLGNTLLMVEHDRDVIRHADRLLDFGPRAGSAGGRIVAQGKPDEFLTTVPTENVAAGLGPLTPPGRCQGRTDRVTPTRIAPADDAPDSLTRAYLNGTTAIPIPSNRRPVEMEERTKRRRDTGTKGGRMRGGSELATRHSLLATRGWLAVRGARQNNLKDITVPIPLGRFICVTGVSGSGKSSLVDDILWPALANRLQRANLTVGEHDDILGAKQLDKVINVDQSPIGSTPSSNPATYTGVFDRIRDLFTRLPESKMRGYNANRFSFNRPGGRCEACEGYGQRCIEMHFMPDVWVECETCGGRRYNPETLEIRFKGKNIADVLEMPVTEALELFANVPKVRRMLQTLSDVGLDYVQLGQAAPTLSAGEAQRVKLAAELGKPDTGRTFYILDEPTTGLHFDDIRKLLAVMHRLADLGNTVLVVEHNLDVLKCADWIIDLGPEAGDAGGYVVAVGTPEELVSGRAVKRAAKMSVAATAASSAGHPSPTSVENVAAGLEPLTPPGRCQGRTGRTRRSKTAATTALPSHTATALRPILEAGRHEQRRTYDPAEHAARELAIEKAGLGDVGREVRLPWQVDGRKWHLEQRTSRDATPTRWEPAALEYVVDQVQKAGPFEPTDWSNRASVEITAAGAQTWFMHALTGGEWLLELCFLVPPGTFKWLELDEQLGLKTLDEREDLQTYGDWSRVDVRPRKIGMEAVVVYVHDKQEIDTPGFRRFIKTAAKAYLKSQGVKATGGASASRRQTGASASRRQRGTEQEA